MKILLQRVAEAFVVVDEKEIARINQGLLVFFAAEKGDEENEIEYLADKTLNLRIFPDSNGKMNRSVMDLRGEVLVVSQFTLAGDCSRGRRPGFGNAAEGDQAFGLYSAYVEKLKESGGKVLEGKFAADMKVHLVNDGPVTFLIESRKK